MESIRGFDDDRGADRDDAGVSDGDGSTAPVVIGTDERRMHVRAYNHWVSLLQGRAYPALHDLDPANIADFGPHSVLLDFSRGVEDPGIAFLGRALRLECGLDVATTHISQVPSRSLLSRLTDHYLEIIANRAPIGFEAEFVSTRGHNTMYRGILMPFSSDEQTIDYLYGVINWKELVDADTQASLVAEVETAVRTAPPPAATAPAWADGPSTGLDDPDEMASTHFTSLPDHLSLAREAADAVRAADARSRTTLYRALARAHAFAAAAQEDPAGYAVLLDEAGLVADAGMPMLPVVELVFGSGCDKTRLAEFAAVLALARRNGVVPGRFATFLSGFDGGIKGVIKAERALSQSAALPLDASAALAKHPTVATVKLAEAGLEGDYVVLIARTGADGTLEIVAAIDDPLLTEQAIGQLAG